MWTGLSKWWRRGGQRRQPARRLWLERLEDRTLLSSDTLNTALPLSFTASPVAQVSDTLSTANQVDLYAVTLHQGDQLTAAVNAQQQGSSLTAALRLFSSSGAELPATDNSTGGDPQLTFSVAASGTYFVGVSSSGDVTYDPTTGGNRSNGNSTGLYSLSVTDLLARFVNATPLNSSGQVLQGTLTGGQPQDYSVTVTGDTFLLATAVPQTSPGFEPRLTLYDATGEMLIQSDQQKPGLAAATLEQHLQPGTYYLEVSAAASSSAAVHQAYQLTTALASSQPPFAPLPVGSEAVAVKVADLGNGQPDIVTANPGADTVSVLLGNGDGTFQPALSFAVGVQPYAVAVADLGNGQPDIVTANSGDNTVSVLMGNGDGTFQPEQAIAVGTQPDGVTVADLGNGHPDIITANYAANTVSVLLGNGDGTFTADPFSSPGLPAGTFAVGFGPYAVAVVDLGNGEPDLVAANYGDSTVSVLLGTGDGNFTPAPFSSPGLAAGTFAVGILPTAVAVADLGNGQADLVTSNSGDNTVSVLLGNGGGSFQPAQAFAVGSAPYGVAVADLGNGHPDIVTANFGADTVSVLLGNGDGTFQPAQPYTVASAPVAVAVADLGNGRADLVTTNPSANLASVLLGNGDGTFQPAQSFAVGSNPYQVTVADLGNGRADLVTANLGANTVSVLLGNGDGTFQPAQSFTVGGAPHSVAVADLGNGHPDIVTCNPAADTVSVLLSNGDGTFQLAQSYVVGSEPYEVAVADLGNGQADIVTSNFGSSSVSVLLGNGDGTFQPAQPFAVGDAPGSVAVADLGNGHPDLVTANAYDNTVSVLLGNGDGTFQAAQPYAVGFAPDWVTVADLGNGHPDLVTTNQGDNTASVLLGNGDGTFQPAQPYAVGFAPDGVAVADLGNGHPDLVTANEGDNTASVLLGNGDGTFQPAQPYAVGIAPDAVAVADLGNGRPDIVTSNLADNTVSVLLGNGDGTFQPAQAFGVASGPQAAAAVDLGNGNVDIVATNFVTNTMSVSLGNGDGTFQPAQSLAVGNGPNSLAVVDVNGDGRADVVTTNAIDDTVSMLLGNGDGTFRPAQSYAVGSDPTSVAVADLGNGRADIVTANSGDNTVSVLLGNGDGTFQPALSFAVGSDPTSVAVADLGNGHPDIITANEYDDTVSVLLGNGEGTFQPALSFSVGSDPTSVAVADLGNGHPDIVTADYGANTVSVLLGNGDGTFQPAQSFAVGSLPDSVAVADFGNGHPDLVTANYGDSTVSVLLGNGDGTFHPAQAFAVANEPESVAVADVNDDGRRDIVTANAGITGTVSVLLNLGQGQFQAPAGPSGIPSRDVPQLQDLTGDGIPDAVSLDQHTGQILFRQGTDDPSNPFAPLVVVNPADRPATDFTLVQTQGLPEIAALDSVDQQVFLYSWSSSAGQFQEIGSFATGPQPVRIASADLDGNGLGDLVVGNDLDNTLTIALQQSPGTFDTFTRNVGAGPSSIAFADLNGDGLPDIVVSGQVSGDVSVLFNDASHSFTTQERYRAGQDPFDVNPEPNGTTLLTQLQTVGVVAGDFTGSGSTDLIALNANIHSFSLLRAAGGGSLIDPQLANTYLVGSGAIEVVTGDFQNNGRQDLAVLTTAANGTSEVLIFLNNGEGTFTLGQQIPANSLATGLSEVPGNGPGLFDLLVGDQFGDILRLVGNGGTFVPAPPITGDRAPLDVITLGLDGRPQALVADQETGQVSIQAPVSGGTQYATVENLTDDPSLHLAPGAVQWAKLEGPEGFFDAVVIASGSNSVIVYHTIAVDPVTGTPTFAAPVSYAVGTDPVAVTIQDIKDINGDGIPDLLVSNKGSNDISVIFGSIVDGQWVGTDGPRLKSGGSGPISVAVSDVTGRNGTGGPDGIPDLIVTNAQSGTMTVLPGVGQGFFNDQNPQPLSLGGILGTPSVNASGAGVVPVGDQLVGFDLNNLAGSIHTVFTFADPVNAAELLADGSVVVALAGGTVDELLPDGVVVPLDALTGIPSDPSALAVLQTAFGLEVLVTNAGDDQVFVFGGLMLTVPSEPPPQGPALGALTLPGVEPALPPVVEFANSPGATLFPSPALIPAVVPTLPAADADQAEATARRSNDDDEDDEDEDMLEDDLPTGQPAAAVVAKLDGSNGAENPGRVELSEPTSDLDREDSTSHWLSSLLPQLPGDLAPLSTLDVQAWAVKLPQPLPVPVPATDSTKLGSLSPLPNDPAAAAADESFAVAPPAESAPVSDSPSDAAKTPSAPAADAVFLLPYNGWESSLPFLSMVAGTLGLWYREKGPGKARVSAGPNPRFQP